MAVHKGTIYFNYTKHRLVCYLNRKSSINYDECQLVTWMSDRRFSLLLPSFILNINLVSIYCSIPFGIPRPDSVLWPLCFIAVKKVYFGCAWTGISLDRDVSNLGVYSVSYSLQQSDTYMVV